MNSCIKVLHIVPDLAYGGVEKVILNYYEYLDHEKFAFDFVTHGNVYDYHKEIIDSGCRIFYFQSMGKIGYREYKKQAEKHIPFDQYDIIHIHVGHLTGVYASIFKKLGKCKIICHAHTTMCVNRWHKVFMPFFRLLSVMYSDALIACGKAAGKYCFGKARLFLIPNGLNFDLFRNVTNEDVDRLKAEFGIKSNTLVVGHIGHFSKQKNHSFLVKIIHDYVRQNNNVKFVLVGDGPERVCIESAIKANGDGAYVAFAGVRKDIVALMKMFDVFVLPSLFEGLPVVGVEAQAAGTPCVFSDTIDTAVCISKGYCEFIPIDKGSDRWVKAINRASTCGRNTNEDAYDALCENGYEIKAGASKLVEVYDYLVFGAKR